jgi:TPR repeat protein
MQNRFGLRNIIASLTVFILGLFMAQAEEPIQKGLGQTLGAVFDTSAATRSAGGADAVNFWYPAPIDTPDLTEFHVSVTPLTYRIFGIYATGEQPGKLPCEGSELALFEMIAKKYNGDQYGGDMREVKNGGGYFLSQSKTHRLIHVGCEEDNGKTKLVLAYLDETLHEAAKKEEQEIAELRADFEAKNYARILPRVQDLARQGNLWAETMLGLMYGQGLGVVHDDDTAEDYYLRAAQRGWLGAEYDLGTFYYKRFRYKPAETWLLKAAEKGYPQAEENLAQLYLAKSPLQSEDKAFTWFLRAAEHGRPESQYNTCYDYADGLGVSRNMVEAYKWCYIAARHGQAQADRNKGHLASQMRPDEVVRGREAAERWLAQEVSGKQ